MSLENARAVYPIMVQLAHDMSQAAKDRRPAVWVSYDDLCARCKEVGIKETPRTIATKLLKPLQSFCLEKAMPDLSALIIQKSKSRGDFGDLIRPADIWWEPYTAQDISPVGNVAFWFKEFQNARDYADWPAEPFF